MDDTELLSHSITKALAYVENGGKVDINNPVKGKTGEMRSIYQFTPATWKNYSKQIFGKEVPMDADTETHVVNEKVKGWVKKGYTASQIASMWNAGESKPDAYKQNWRGINKKYGVAFDTPAYASKVLKYSKQFYGEKRKDLEQGGQKGNPLESIIKTINQASSKSQPIASTNNQL